MRLTYRDAVKILGAGQSPLVSALDKIFGGLLLGGTPAVPALLSLFDAKSELIKLTHELVVKGIERRQGLGQFDRIQQLHAARGVLMVVAYFESVETADLPFRLGDARISRGEMIGLATDTFGTGVLADVANTVLEVDLPLVGVQTTSTDAQERLERFYKRLNDKFRAFLQGLRLWEDLDAVKQMQAVGALERVVSVALRLFDTSVQRLATDCPEFAIWLNLSGQRAIRDRIEDVYAAVRALLDRAEPVETLLPALQGIVRFNRSTLDRKLLPVEELPDGLEAPTVGSAYIDPHFRMVEVTAQTPISDEDFWSQVDVRKDFDEFLLGHLSTPWAWAGPLVILGHPGAGKSLLTEVQAARLPSPDYVTVRVPLRDVPADVDIHEQIEHAIRASTHETVSWPDFARAAGGSLLVVLLDGFDELLQATGVSRSDYLVRIQRFQEIERTQGRPVAVIVTSRVTVADRMRFPTNVIAVRLEPFEINQVEQWLEVWNEINSAYLSASGRGEFDLDVIETYLDLARQPLLLLMLAVYDAEGGALRADRSGLSQAELYERLVCRFAHREVSKKDDHVADDDPDVARELLILSVVAFGMFNRAAQWITDAQLADDLTALGVTPQAAQEVTAGHHRLAGEAKNVLGRFFYIHRARTTLEGVDLGTYEFLHATFAEYLVARLTWRCLNDLVRRSRAETSRLFPGHHRVDDAELRTFLSWALLSTRTTTLDFLSEFAGRTSATQLADMREVLLITFRAVHQPEVNSVYQAYRPLNMTPTARLATYSANLLLLIMTVGADVSSEELFPDAADHKAEWTRSARLWMSQLRPGEWNSLTDLFTAERRVDPRGGWVLLAQRGSTSGHAPKMMWPREPRMPAVVTNYDFTINFFPSAELLCEWDTDVVVTALSGPGSLFTKLIPYYTQRDGDLRSVAADVLAASLFHVNQVDREARMVVYDRIVAFVESPHTAPDYAVIEPLQTYVLQLLVNDDQISAEYIVGKVSTLSLVVRPDGPENLTLLLRLLSRTSQHEWFLDVVEELVVNDAVGVEELAEIWCALTDKGITSSEFPTWLLDEAHHLRWPAREIVLAHRPDLLRRLSRLEDDELL